MAGNRGFIDVDTLQQQFVAGGDVVEKLAKFYNRELPKLHQTQQETRMACTFACGRQEATGDRALSIKTQENGALFRCFHYGCTVRGNLLNLMFLMKHNELPTGGKLQGAEFKEIAGDLKVLVAGGALETPPPKTATEVPTPSVPKINVPLKDSENERARELVTLDERFVTDVAAMNEKASAYVRQRPYLTPEIMQKFRCGYLPHDAGSLLRGHFVYGWPDADGNILTWFGRNLGYEEQHRKWRRAGDSTREPHKFRFVKGFHRGLELYGEPQLRKATNREQSQEIGVIVVEGPNDVMALSALGVPAVAVCSNTVTETQADRLAMLAEEFGGGTVSVMFDLDREGENGAKQAVLELAQRCRVRYAWTTTLSDGKFCDLQPESVTLGEWQTAIHPALRDVL